MSGPAPDAGESFQAGERRPVPPSRPEPAEPGTRGRLTISGTAVRHLVETAAAEVPGVVSKRSTGMLRSEGGVNANVLVEHDRARVRLNVAVIYPASVPTIVRNLRAHVAARLADLADVRVAGFDVSVSTFVLPHAPVGRVLE
ncbi:MAG: Asp23/Gls24 family envelope stress response protein [Mycobacteriales bacterium]